MSPVKRISVNRKAFYEYDILERLEAGMVLTGTEIKSVRASRVSLQEAFARTDKGAIWLFNAHIAYYPQGGIYNHDPTRPRKLLLHRSEIIRLTSLLGQRGLTLVPLSLYIKNHLAKVELGLAQGRRKYDKRRVIAERDAKREIHRALRLRRY